MKKFQFTSPASEQKAFDSSIGLNGMLVLLALVLLVGSMIPNIFRLIAYILIWPFLIIAFARNLTLIRTVSTRGRKIYAIVTTIITGAVLIALFSYIALADKP